ncbi:MAG: response regulator [Anaerolineaceae bacterium]|nr:MAG: response regulator [Anaerolineaceae bacterium]HRQ32373.1 response regulator [Anaerolineales bacterium]
MTEKTILIIEDEPDAAELFAEMMRVSGFNVLKITSSASAFAMLADKQPDLVVLDIMMPDVSGLEVLQYMRSDPTLERTPVVIVSAKSSPADIKVGLDAGATAYLVKPVGFLELKDAVRRALGE